MTNEQLAILVASWAARLGREIGLLRESLPKDLPRHSGPIYVGGQLLGAVIDKRPEAWQQHQEDYIALDGLKGLRHQLNNACSLLLGKPQDA